MLVYRLCISVLLTCELHLFGLSQINTRWSVTSPVLTRCLRDYVNVFSMIYLLPVVFMLLVQVQVIDWKDQLLRNDLVLQFVDGDVKPDSLTPPTVQSLYYYYFIIFKAHYTSKTGTVCDRPWGVWYNSHVFVPYRVPVRNRKMTFRLDFSE